VLLGVLACAAAVGLTLPALATAAKSGGGLHYVSGNASNSGDTFLETEALCPSSSQAVGGGVRIPGFSFSLEVAGTFPSIFNSGEWAAEANNSTTGSAGVEALGICGPGQMVYPHKNLDVAPGDQGNASVKCPPETKLTGGGVTADTTDLSMEVAETAPFDRSGTGKTLQYHGWKASMNNDPPGGTQGAPTHTMTVYAACAPTGRYRYVKSPQFTVRNQDSAGREALCPAKTRVTGGGITNTGLDLGTELADDFPIDTSRDRDTIPDNGWRAEAQNDVTGNTDETAQVFAICKRV
jgi:hypothetical protein